MCVCVCVCVWVDVTHDVTAVLVPQNPKELWTEACLQTTVVAVDGIANIVNIQGGAKKLCDAQIYLYSVNKRQ